jgi:nicotinamide-nucleotide amidase
MTKSSVGNQLKTELTDELIGQLLELLRAAKATLSFAESCSGGRLSATLSERPGVSDVFVGSVVSYANQAKADLLGVSWEALNSEGAVSEKVVRQMATGARTRFNSSWSVAITGIAGPSGGSTHKPVGLVWFAVSGVNFEEAQRRQFSGDRVAVQTQSVEFALRYLVDCISKKN